MSGAIHDSLAGLDWHKDGYASLSGALLQYAERLDATFARWATGFGATEFRFPTMIAARDLAPVAYLKSFPHLATFVTSADRSEHSLHSLANECATANSIDLSNGRFEPAEQLLAPAACYHFYPRLAGTALSGPTYLTTICQCHRRELEYLPLQRQWCFQMREIVCIGNGDSIDDFIRTAEDRIAGLVAHLGLQAAWETATDPFFDPAHDPKALSQMLEPSKRELCTPAGLAIGSINRHRSFFGESYDIRCGGKAANSACVAFGIERWLHALLETHGNELRRWPDPEAG